jgi:hypothetical protein
MKSAFPHNNKSAPPSELEELTHTCPHCWLSTEDQQMKKIRERLNLPRSVRALVLRKLIHAVIELHFAQKNDKTWMNLHCHGFHQHTGAERGSGA